jgi:hypothetical protein
MERELRSRFPGAVCVDAKPCEFELTFPDPMHEFDCYDEDHHPDCMVQKITENF